jgi:hypothetical protein
MIFTASQARIFEWALEQGRFITIATETIRCHPRRPGLMNAGSRQAQGANEGFIDISTVIATFEKVRSAQSVLTIFDIILNS